VANKTLSIHAKVNNAASAPLDKIKNSLKGAGGAAKQAGIDFTKFNQTMFTTSAYIGFFALSFKKFGDVIAEGAKFDRLEGQFERVMGPKGELFKQIAEFTDNSIDRVEAMRSAIAIKTLGIAADTKQVAEIIAMAGTAGKNAGLESGEGIKKFTQFLKDGSVSNLEFLNLMSSQSSAFKLQMALISKYGGVLGGAMTAQAKYSMGMRLLRLATKDTMMGQRDLYDVVLDAKQAFSMLGREVGRFFGEALKSTIGKLTRFADVLSTTLEDIRLNKKEILFLTGAIVKVTSALAGLMATIGTLRLLSIAFKSIGITAFPLIAVFGTVASLFIGLTHNISEGDTALQKFVNKLKGFSAVFQGIYQLVSSFLEEPDNFAKGIGKMDKALYTFLDQNGLFKFAYNVSKVIATVMKFGSETFKVLKTWALELDKIFGDLSNKFLSFFGLNEKLNVNLKATGNTVDEPSVKRSSRLWVDASKTFYKFLTKGAAALTVAFALGKMLGIGKGALSKMPVIGKFFAGKSKEGPKGTATDPIYVKDTSASFIGPKPLAATGVDKLIGSLKNIFNKLPAIFFNLFNPLSATVRFVASLFSSVGAVFSRLIPVLFLAQAAFNFVKGAAESAASTFESFKNLLSSVFDFFANFDYNTLFSKLEEFFGNLIGFIGGAFSNILEYIKGGFSSFVELITNYVPILKTAFDFVAEKFNELGAMFVKFGEWISTLPGFQTVKDVATSLWDAAKGVVTGEAFAGAGKMLTEGAGMAFDASTNAVKNSTAEQMLSKAKTGQTVTMPENNEARIDYAKRAIEASDGADKQRMTSAYQAAVQDNIITPEEWANIFGQTLEKATITKAAEQTKINTKPKPNSTITSKRC
jgi:hypothetical protein